MNKENDQSSLKVFPLKDNLIAKNFKGNQIQMISNCYNVKINRFQKFLQYSVQIFYKEDFDNLNDSSLKTQEAIPQDSRQKREDVINFYNDQIEKRLGFYVQTGSIIYAVSQSQNETKLIFHHPKNDYCLKLKLVDKNKCFNDIVSENKSKRPLMQMINSFIKEILKKQNFLEWGNNKRFFNPKLSKYIPQYDMKIYQGCTFKADVYQGGIKLLVNPCFKFIRMQNLYKEFISKEISEENINDYFCGKSVYAVYNQKMFILKGADLSMNLNSPFPDDKYKTFKEYFEKNYNIKFAHPEQFLVYADQINAEQKEQRVYYPPEVLNPTGLTGKMINDTKFLKQLAKHTIKTPDENFRFIKESLKNLDLQKNKMIKMTVDMDKNQVQAYQMEAPKFLKKGKKPFNNQKFQVDEFYQNKEIKEWLLFYDFKNQKNVGVFLENIFKCAEKLKYKIDSPKKFLMEKNFSPQSLQKEFKKLSKKPMIIVFFVDKKLCNKIYKKIKTFLNIKGIQSQCFTNFNRYQDQKSLKKYFNLVTQISVKVGSVPWAIDLKIKNAVLMGFDVFHQRNKKSVASLVSLYGKNYVKNHSSTRLQKTGLEIMKNLVDLVKEHLTIIEEKSKTFPDKIIFYRDGVGEGQVQTVMEEELQRIYSYLHETYKEKAPKMTFILITKRIDQRFIFRNKNRHFNPNQGVIVCDQIVKTERPNFYMVANSVNQGTAVPTHYDIICDENSFELNEITQLTYSLTHMYFNWTGTVKVPAMAQYAHKQAYQIGLYQDDQVHKKMKNSFFFL